MSSGLYTQPQFPSPQFPPSPPQYAAGPRGGGSWILSLLLVGGGVLILVSVMFVGAVWYAMSSLEGWMVGLGREGMVAMVEESEIPPAEKKEVVAQIDRVVAAYQANEIGQEDLERLLTGVDDSFLMTYISFYGIQDYLLEESTVPAEEKEALRLAWRRVAHGMFSGKITRDEFENSLPSDVAFEEAAEESPDARNEVLRKWQARMTKLADDAGSPADPPAVDIGDEARKLVDRLLAK